MAEVKEAKKVQELENRTFFVVAADSNRLILEEDRGGIRGDVIVITTDFDEQYGSSWLEIK